MCSLLLVSLFSGNLSVQSSGIYVSKCIFTSIFTSISIVTEIYESIWKSSIPIKYHRVLYSFFPFCICKSLSWHWETLLPPFFFFFAPSILNIFIRMTNHTFICMICMHQYPVPIRLWIPSAAHPYPDPPYTTGALYLMFDYPFTEMPSPPCSRSWLDSLGKSSYEVQFSSVAQSCLTLCSPIDCSTPSFAVHHQLPELAQTPVINSYQRVGEAIQPSHPLLSPSPPAFNLSQHQGLFQRVSSSHQVTRVLEFQLQHQSFQWIFRTDFLGLSLGLQENGVKRAYALA